MEFTKGILNNQPNIAIGVVLASLVLLGFYIKLLDIYK